MEEKKEEVFISKNEMQWLSRLAAMVALFLAFNVSIAILWCGLFLLGITIPITLKGWAGVCLIGWATNKLCKLFFKTWKENFENKAFLNQLFENKRKEINLKAKANSDISEGLQGETPDRVANCTDD